MLQARRWCSRALLPLLAVAFAGAASAAVQPVKAPEVAELEFRHPQLHIENSYQPVGDLPATVAADARRDLDGLGLDRDSGRFDLRSGRWGTLLLSRPLIPGDGKGNLLRWDAGRWESAPSNDAVLGQRAWDAFATFLEEHQSELRLPLWEMANPGRVTVHDGGDLIHIWTPRVIDGVPVRDSYLTAVINHGNLVLLGARNWGDLTTSTRADLSAEAAIARVGEHLSGAPTGAMWRRPSLQIVPLAQGSTLAQVEPGEGLEYRLAWAVHPTLRDDQGRWQALIDAATGELLLFEDTNHYATARRVVGGVYPVSNDGVPPDGVEVPGEPMPFDIVQTPTGSVETDSGGNLPIAVDGNITSNLDGVYTRILDNCGSISLTSTGDLDFGTSGGDDCTTPGFGGAGNTHSARSGFYELTRINEQARHQLPENNWLETQLTANMNINNSCNAFWNGATVNFYRSGGGCGNTGELAGVFDHEWGHGLDDNDANPNISNPGEGIPDIYAGMRLNTSCIGRGFFGGNCGGYGDPCVDCTGIRDIDFAQRQSGQPHDIDWIDANCSFGGGPCGGIVHCEGAVYSEAAWDIYTRALPNLYGFDSNTALEAATWLTYHGANNVGTWFQCTTPFGGCNADGGYLNYLAADDDNGDLNDGTPHMNAIFTAYDNHQIACNTPVVQDSGCAGTPTQAPVVTGIGVDKGVNLEWDAVADAQSYNVYRAEGVFQCDFGKVLVGSTTGTSFIDTGLQNDRDYSYVVIPMGPGDTCWGPASSCTTVVPVPGPNLAVDAGSLTLTIDTGDGDEFLDNCEMATATFEVVNTGVGTLNNVQIVAISSPSHPDIIIDTPLPAPVSPDVLAEGQTGIGTFEFTAEGLGNGDTVVFAVEVAADELVLDIASELSVFNVESDLERVDEVRYTFENGTDGWEVVEGTFIRQNDAGGGAQGTPWYMQSSSFLPDECDHIRSPVLQLTTTSTLETYTRFDIEAEFTPGVWYDRANFGIYDPSTGNRAPVNPDSGRLYNASGANGTCGTDGQEGWADTMDSWAASGWSVDALNSEVLAGIPIQLDVRYGTDPAEHGYGFRFDQVTVTDVDLVVSDGQANSCDAGLTLLPPDPGLAGQDNDFVVTGATPGNTIGVAGSLTAGVTSLVCGVDLALDSPLILGSAVADASGEAVVTKNIPGGASGRSIYFQAVDIDACVDTDRLRFAFP